MQLFLNNLRVQALTNPLGAATTAIALVGLYEIRRIRHAAEENSVRPYGRGRR